MLKLMYRLFYFIKPLIPRKIQILLRNKLAKRSANKYESIWPILETSSTKPTGWKGWPDDKQFALILTHDVEHQRGYDRVLDLMRVEQEMGFISSFNFVPERDYKVEISLIDIVKKQGFEVGVQGLYHDGKLYSSRKEFLRRAERINSYLKDWEATGFRSPAMHHNLEWLLDLNIDYDLSTFDTDPFEPQSDGAETIFPFMVKGSNGREYLEMPYTLPQDSTLFIILKEKDISIWKNKLDWIAAKGGMALLNVHPDYINFDKRKSGYEEFPISHYREFLKYVKDQYGDSYWNVLPKEVVEVYKDQVKLSANFNTKQIIPTVSLKKVCMVVQSNYDLDPRVRRQTSALINAGYSVDVICLGAKGKSKSEFVNRVNVKRIMTQFPKKSVSIYLLYSTIFFIKATIVLTYLSLRNRYSLIQIHNMPDHLVFVSFFERIFGVPVILDIHDLTLELFREKWSNLLFNISYPFLKFFEYLSCKFSTHILTVTQQCVDILNKRGVPKEKLSLILNVADQNKFPLYAERKFREYNSEVNIFYHGTIAKRFGLHIVIKAMPEILTELPGSRLFIYGGGDYLYINNLKKMINNLKITDNVFLPGLIKYEQVNEFIRKMDIGIVPYLDTPYMNLALSTKAFEYISSGLPICASSLEATRTIFRECSISYFDPNNIHDVAEKIIFLAKNPSLQEGQVKSALEDISLISGQEMQEKYLQVVNNLVNANDLDFKKIKIKQSAY